MITSSDFSKGFVPIRVEMSACFAYERVEGSETRGARALKRRNLVDAWVRADDILRGC